MAGEMDQALREITQQYHRKLDKEALEFYREKFNTLGLEWSKEVFLKKIISWENVKECLEGLRCDDIHWTRIKATHFEEFYVSKMCNLKSLKALIHNQIIRELYPTIDSAVVDTYNYVFDKLSSRLLMKTESIERGNTFSALVQIDCDEILTRNQCLGITKAVVLCYRLPRIDSVEIGAYCDLYISLKEKLDDIGLFVEDGDFSEDFEELIKTRTGHDAALNSEPCIATFVKWQRDAEIIRASRLNRIIAKLIRSSVRKELPNSDSSTAIEIFMRSEEVEIPGKEISDQLKQFLRSKNTSIDLTGHNESDKYSDLRLGPLKFFHDGLETHLGYPALDVFTAMKNEHLGDGLFERFSGKLASTEYLHDIRNVSKIVNPKTEWYQVILGKDHKQQQNVLEIAHRQVENSLEFYYNLAERKVLGALPEADSGVRLSMEEVAAIRLWTGPMYKRYALFFRACITDPLKSIQYATTMHAINSAITKLAKIWKLPLNRKVYRGYNNLQPGESAQLRDKSRCRGGVDPCVFATSEDFDVAVAYSKHGFILEIEVGQVDRGADISWLSQFPHEREILFQALSNLEFVGEPRNFFTEDGKIQLHAIRINANLKSKTLDQFKEMRKVGHEVSFNYLHSVRLLA